MRLSISFVLFFTVYSLCAVAQTVPPKEKMTREEKQEKSQARQERINNRNDYAIFRRQITAMKEFSDEKKKIPKLQADNKTMAVKVVIAIDSVDEGDTMTKALTGYIVQNIGDNAMLLYDLSFDRTLKKIVSIQRTAEAIEADKAEKEEREEKAEEKKTGTKHTVHKKTGDDDDDDEPEEKPSKVKDEN